MLKWSIRSEHTSNKLKPSTQDLETERNSTKPHFRRANRTLLFWKSLYGTHFCDFCDLDSGPIQLMPRKASQSSVCPVRTEDFRSAGSIVLRTRQRTAAGHHQLCCGLDCRLEPVLSGAEVRRVKEEGAAGSAACTHMNTPQSADEDSLAPVSALIPRWEQRAGKSPCARRN